MIERTQNGIEKRELESVLQGYGDFSASAASGLWWTVQNVKIVLHVVVIVHLQ